MEHHTTFLKQILDSRDRPCPACEDIQRHIDAAEARGATDSAEMHRRVLANHRALTCARSRGAKYVNK